MSVRAFKYSFLEWFESRDAREIVLSPWEAITNPVSDQTFLAKSICESAQNE